MPEPHSPKHLVFEIEMPDVYTADIEGLREYRGEFESESDFIRNCIGAEGGVVRVRLEISGEKDSDVVEIWGHIRDARLVDPSRGYEGGDSLLNGDQVAAHGVRLMRDAYDHGCEWCRLPEPSDG